MVLMAMLFIISYLAAVSAYPDLINFTQPDGTEIQIFLKGDEKVNWAETPDGYTIIFNKAGFYEYAKLNEANEMVPSGLTVQAAGYRSPDEQRWLAKIPKHLFYSASQLSVLRQVWDVYRSETRAFPTIGNRKLICILIGFTDLPFTKTQSQFNDLFNQVGFSAGSANGSVTDYYQECSYNQLTLTTDVVGPYTASHNMAYYDEDARPLVVEAINFADPDVDFSDYDNDDNGWVDGIYVIHSGYGEDNGGPEASIWAHAWGLENPVHKDGVSMQTYSTSSELRGGSGNSITGIGVICHEFGHTLGVPDFYDTNYAEQGQYQGTGDWDLMGSGNWNLDGDTPAHHNGLSKIIYLHWASWINLSYGATITLENSVENNDSFYRYETTTPDEYFFVENRQKIGFDTAIPGEGMLIYHVHSDFPTPTNQTHPQRMYPVSQNATMDPTSNPSSYGSINSSTCPWNGTGKTIFSDTSLPSSKSWSGANTNQPIMNIARNTQDRTVSFTFAQIDPYGKYWTGALSSDWHNPGNWYGNTVPNATHNVVIPSNTGVFPSISGADASCANLHITIGARIGIGYANLMVYEDIISYGKIIMATETSAILVARDIFWKSFSELDVWNADAKIFCKRGMTFEGGSNVQAALGTIIFFSGAHNPEIDYESYIINQSANTQLNNLVSDKAGNYSLQISASSTEPFSIYGDLKCYQNRRIRSFFDGVVSLKGNLISENTNSAGIFWNSGTLKLIGTNQSISIPNSSGFLFSLWAANTGTISSPHALRLKGNLQVDGSAEIIVDANDLTVDGTSSFTGKLVMNSSDGSLMLGGSATWEAFSTLEINSDDAKIFCEGSMTLENLSNFNMIRGTVEFNGDIDAIIVNHSPNTKFHHLLINKSSGAALAISAVSTRDITITGDFLNAQNSIFRSYYTSYLLVEGNFISQNSNSAGIQLEAGVLVLIGTSPNLAFAHAGDYIYTLRSNPSGSTYLLSNITVKGDFSLIRGCFYAAGNTIKVGGNWSIQSGATFIKGTSTVIFNGSGSQTVSSTQFNILRLSKAGGGEDNKLIISNYKIVTAASYKWDAGTIEVTGGSFSVADLADNNIKGNYKISSGLIRLTQDSQYFVDLDANLNISGGTISIQGGYDFPADWAYTRAVTVIMSGGVLEYNGTDIDITNTAHALNLQITGGTIRTKGSFTISRTSANFSGGLVELYGTDDATLSCAGTSSFNDVKINKTATRSNKVTIAQNTSITGDLTVFSGTLALNAVTLNIGRDLYVYSAYQMNNTGATLNIGRDFVLGGGSNVEITRGIINITRNLSQAANTPLMSSVENTINFVGVGDSNLSLMNPTASLGNIGVNKSSGTVGISTTAAALNLLGNMTVSPGNQFMFRTIPTVIAGALNVNGSILLSAGGSVTCYDLNMYGNISVAGNLSVQHDYYQAAGTQLIIGSSGNFIIDKPYTGNFQSFAGTTIINGGAITIVNDGIQFGASSNLTFNSGTLKIGGSLRAMVADSFHLSTGAIEFIGHRSASIQLASGNYLNNVIVTKTGTGVVMLSSDLLLRDLMINSGTFQLLHRTLNITGNLNIMDGTLDAAFADDLINLSGWWNNNRSPNGFTQGYGTVAFVGAQRSVIYQTEQFKNLIVNKTRVYPDGVELETGATLSVESLNFMDGTIYLKGGSTFNTPASGFTLPVGCAVYCDPSLPTTINLNGDWYDNNFISDANQGFSSGASIVNVLGAGPRNLISSVLKLNSLNVNLSSGECYISDYEPELTGDVHLISGTLSAQYGSSYTLHKGLSTAAGTTLALSGCSLSFVGSENAELSIGGTADYSSITIAKEIGSSISLGSSLTMPASSMLNVQQGILQLDSRVLSAGGDINIGSGGEVLVNANAQLLMQGSNLLNVNSGGKLTAIGTSGQPALVSRGGAFYYSLNVYPEGTIAAEHAIFEYMSYSGVNLHSGATVSPEYSFTNCTFRNGSYGGTLLNIGNGQALTITGAVFPQNTWFGMSNVAKNVSSGSVRFLGESGAFAGAGFESDPFMRINWNNEIPSLSTDLSSLSFGSVYIPMSEYRTFSITNNGSGSLAGVLHLPDNFTASIYRTESREGNSKIDEPQRTGSLDFIVLPGYSIQVQVTFMPTQPIAYNSTLVITHNAGGAPINISLTGYGMGAQITVNPTQIIKGILPGGSHTETLSITDSGNTALSYFASIEYPTRSRDVIISESFEIGFPPSGWSTAIVQQVGTAGVWNRSTSMIHPGGYYPQDGQYLAIFNSWTCSTGNQTRLQSGYLNFSAFSNINLSFWMYHDNAYPTANDRIQVQINTIQDTWVNVGEPIVRTQSPYGWQQHNISLSAYGNQNYLRLGLLAISQYGNDLNIDNIVVTGSNPPTGWVFFNGQATSVSNIIAPGATDQHQVNINTNGMAPGIHQAEIHIATNDPITSVKVVPITISIGSPGLSFSPASLDYGVLKIGTSATQNISIEATGSLHLSGTITVPTGYSLQAATRDGLVSAQRESAPIRWAGSVNYTLSPGEIQTYEVKFSPTATQAYNGSISITSDHLATQTIQLSAAGANVPTVQTLAATAITSSSATLNANITSTGGLISWRGFKYGTDPDPINNGADYHVASSNNSYSAFPTGFESGQQIYFCAFAYNELGWSYGEVLSFTTLHPQLIVTPATTIEFGVVAINTTSAEHSFTVSGSDLPGTVGLNASPGFRISLDSRSRAMKATTDQISLYPVAGVLAETSIYVWFEPSLVQSYSGTVSIVTLDVPEIDIALSGTGITIPTLSTIEATEITLSSATSGGNITDNGGSSITARGVCWSESPDPSLADEHSSDSEGSGIFTSHLSELLPGTQYFVSAYATNLAGTVYSESITFFTLSAPVVSASPMLLESFGSIVAGEVSGSKSFIVAGSGLSANLLVTAPTGFQIALGGSDRQRDFSSEISIAPSSGSVFTTILVRFAPSSGGAFSDNIIISSAGAENVAVLVSGIGITKPVLTTKAITNISSISASSGGIISSDGFSEITISGICWSLNPEPSTADFTTLKLPAVWDFDLVMNNLLPNTTYFVRAFAINAAGIAYGNELSFSTTMQALAVPANLIISKNAAGIQLNWDSVPGAISYKIYRSLNPYATDWGAPIDTITNHTWTDLALQGTYFYKVTASSEAVRDITK